LSELAGGRSSGRTALLLASLAEALRRGEAVALVDVGGTLDPRAAARGGVTLSRLLWIRCSAGKALSAAEIVLSAGGFGLVALDLGEERPTVVAPVPQARRGGGVPTAAWLRLKRGAEQQGTAVLVTSARRLQGAQGSCAVTLSQARPRFAGGGAPPLPVGLEARAEAERGGQESEAAPHLAFSHED
jgi:RecA/RadA recombinase